MARDRERKQDVFDLGTGAVTLGASITVNVNSFLKIGGAVGDGGHGYSITKGDFGE